MNTLNTNTTDMAGNDGSIRPDSGPVLGDKEVAKIGSTTIVTDTISGAAWVRKYEHPPAPMPVDYCGIPDLNNTPSAHAEYRAVQEVQTYSTAAGPPPVVTNYNKVLLMVTSGVAAPVIPFKVDTAGNLTQIPTDIVLNPNFNAQDMVTYNAAGRLAYKSITTNLNANGFNNQGVVSSALYRPNLSRMPVIALLKRIHGKRNELEILQGLHDFFVSEVDRDGYVPVRGPAGGKVVSELEMLRAILTEHFADPAMDNFVQVVQFGKMPLTSTQVIMTSPNAVSTVATEGSFMVQGFSQPTSPYLNFGQTGLPPAGTAAAPKAIPCYYESFHTDGVSIFPFVVADQPGNTSQVLVDVPWGDFLWGWILYEGLSVQPSSATAVTVVPPFLTVKCITGFEFQPLPDSLLSPFIKNSAEPDRKALELAAHIRHGRMDSLPARYNFWGALGKILLTAAPSVISTVSNIFGKTRTAKEEKTTNDTVKRLTAQIDQMQTKLSAPRKKAAPARPHRETAPRRPEWATEVMNAKKAAKPKKKISKKVKRVRK